MQDSGTLRWVNLSSKLLPPTPTLPHSTGLNLTKKHSKMRGFLESVTTQIFPCGAKGQSVNLISFKLSMYV